MPARSPPATTRTSTALRAISVVGLVALYSDAVVRVIAKLVALREPPPAASVHTVPASLRSSSATAAIERPEQLSQSPPRRTASLPPPPSWTAAAQRLDDSAAQAAASGAAELELELGMREAETSVEETERDEDEGGCGAHRLLYGNMDADLGPWHASGLRVTAAKMKEQVEFVRKHRGRWDSWVSDTLTPILIRDGQIYLSLGPPTKDPTNYFWTVLRDLLTLSRRTRLPDVEFLLNMADMPVVAARASGAPSVPVPVFSYCKRDGFLDVLVPGYYSPDRVCGLLKADEAKRAHPWPRRREMAFARYTHFCKPQQQRDVHGRALPPCARSYFAALAQSRAGRRLLDVRPTNTVNDTTDPSLAYGAALLPNGSSIPIAEHARYKYLLDTDGFSSAYKLQQLLAVGSVVLHPASTWRAYYYHALLPYVHYVPLWQTAQDDVLPAIRWLKRHDRVARRIGAAGRRLACEHLTQHGRLCYWRRLLRAYAELTDSVASLAERPRAFPLARLNIMCRERDAPNVCYYNVHPGPPLPKGYVCHKPVPGVKGSFEECWYEG